VMLVGLRLPLATDVADRRRQNIARFAIAVRARPATRLPSASHPSHPSHLLKERLMRTAQTASKARQPAKRASSASGPDAIALLKQDHAEVKALFKEYDKLAEADAEAGEREMLALQICDMLTVHATIEEEIFYPAAREALSGDNEDLLDEAEVEHASAKDLIAQIQSTDASDALFNAKVKVLGEYIDHHVKEEQNELFPKLKGKLDAKAIGARLQARKEDLTAAAH
jgi:hemerythrin-like domain-containing protein